MPIWRPDRKGVFAFNWVGTSSSIIVLVSLLGLGYWNVGEKFDFCSISIFAIVLLIVAMIPGYIVFRLAKRDVMAGNVAFAISLFVLIGLSFSLLVSAQRKSAEAFQEFDASMAEMSESRDDLIARSIAGEDVSEEMQGRYDTAVDAVDQLAESGGRDGQAMAVLATVMRSIQKPLSGYQQASAAYVQAGGSTPSGLPTVEAIDQRIAILDAFSLANDRFDLAYDAQKNHLQNELAANGFSPDEVNFLVSKWEIGAAPELASRLREAERQWAATEREFLLLLQEHIGRWQYDSESGVVTFVEPAANQRFEIITKQSESHLIEIERLQREIQSRVQQSQRGSS